MGIDAEIDVSQGGDVIQTLKDEIYCSICCSIFQDPLKLDCCDGHLCKACFDDVKIKFPCCPLCRASNYTAKPSRLMVSVLSTITLCCPAEECNQKILYSQFMKHKETCVFLNMKTCYQCKAKMEFEESKRHLNCVGSLLKSLNKFKKENEALKRSNEAEKKHHEAEMKKYNATKVSYAGLTVKHEKTLAEFKRNKSHIKMLERSTDIHKKSAASAKQKADEKLKQSELKSNSVIEALKAEIKVLRSRNVELVEENRLKNELYESKISASEAALRSKVLVLKEWLDKNDNEKNAIQVEVLKLQNQMTEMEKKVDEKNDQISQFRDVLTSESNSPEVIKLKNEIALTSLNKFQKENEDLKKSNDAEKKAKRSLRMKNEIEKKQHEAEMKKYEETKKSFAGLTVKHTKTLEEKKKAETSCVKYKKIAAQMSAAKQKTDEKLKQSKLKSNPVIEALKAEIKVLRSRNIDLVEENRTKVESYEAKMSSSEAALQKKVEQLTEWLDKNNNEKSARQAEVLMLQNKMTEMEKKVDEKNDQISKFRNVLSVESSSPEVIKLKNEIGRVEQSAILYFQMYKKEKKLNQEMQSRITSCFSCSSSLIFKICLNKK